MNPPDDAYSEEWEARLAGLARRFSYPATPDIAGQVSRRLAAGPQPAMRRVSRRSLARLALVIALLLAALLAVPGVRAAVLEFLQIGAVRIFLVEPTPIPATGTPAPTPTLLPSLLNLSGKTTLEQAQEELSFPIRLPAATSGLGTPDYVFLQDLGGPVLVLAWGDPAQPGQVRLSLHEFGQGTFAAEKVQPQVLAHTQVNGNPAVWTTGPYILRLRNEDIDLRRLVEGHVLIWQAGAITYRLETSLPMEAAIRIAETLEAYEPTPDK